MMPGFEIVFAPVTMYIGKISNGESTFLGPKRCAASADLSSLLPTVLSRISVMDNGKGGRPTAYRFCPLVCSVEEHP